MTPTQTLRAAIRLANTNGYNNPALFGTMDLINQWNMPPRAVLGILLMNHDFCRALWGEEWMVRTQTVAVSDDPFGYLAGSLEERG
jgi:hypothetical protein